MPIYNRISAKVMPQKPGMQGIWEQIEAAARTCYRSEGKTQYDADGNSITAEQFANKIVNVYKHRSVAEHAAIYLMLENDFDNATIIGKYVSNKHSKVNYDTMYAYITTNYRVILENKWEGDLKYMVEPTEYHAIRRTVRLFTDRGVSAESNRHRCQSPTERSTRFVNYANDNNISICVPEEISDNDVLMSIDEWGGADLAFRNMCLSISDDADDQFSDIDTWLFANLATEWSYLRLIELGWKPQQARRVLPMDVETELVISAYEEDWVTYFGQRYFGSTGTPHPDMKESCAHIMDAFVDAGWTNSIESAMSLYGRK